MATEVWFGMTAEQAHRWGIPEAERRRYHGMAHCEGNAATGTPSSAGTATSRRCLALVLSELRKEAERLELVEFSAVIVLHSSVGDDRCLRHLATCATG